MAYVNITVNITFYSIKVNITQMVDTGVSDTLGPIFTRIIVYNGHLITATLEIVDFFEIF